MNGPDADERTEDAHRVSIRCDAGTQGSASAFCSPRKEAEQVAAAEKLLAEIDPDRIYTYEYVCYRITRVRWKPSDVKFAGGEAKHDCGCSSKIYRMPPMCRRAAGERVVTIEELARRFNVSTKTISRWRRLGLISRRFVMDGRKRVGFLESSVNRFVAQNSDKVRRGSQFSQLTRRARAIHHRARRLARQEGRRRKSSAASPASRAQSRDGPLHAQAIRPGKRRSAIFPENQGPSSGDQAKDLPPVPSGRVGRSALQAIFPHAGQHLPHTWRDAGPADCRIAVGLRSNEEFPKALRASKREQRDPRADAGQRRAGEEGPPSPGLPPYLASLYEVPLLSRNQEAHLFRKMNYLKYKAGKLREGLDPSQPKSSVMDEIDALYRRGGGHEEPDRPRQSPPGGLDCQAARGTGGKFLRVGQRRQCVADAGRGKVRFRAGIQVQHLCKLGNHEELCPDDSR